MSQCLWQRLAQLLPTPSFSESELAIVRFRASYAQDYVVGANVEVCVAGQRPLAGLLHVFGVLSPSDERSILPAVRTTAAVTGMFACSLGCFVE